MIHDPEALPVRVLAAVVRRGERYLLCRRALHRRHGGLWEFPGGKIEPRESPEEAAARELREEVGVDVTAVGTARFGIRDADSPYLIEFVDVEIEGEPVPIEHDEVRWCTREEIAELPLAPGDRAFVMEAL